VEFTQCGRYAREGQGPVRIPALTGIMVVSAVRDCQTKEIEVSNMPHSVPVSKLMVNRNEWPQLRSDMNVSTAIKLLRIITEDQKLEHGHSTPLIMDENYNLVGFVHLIDLLKSVRPLCDKPDEPCRLPENTTNLRELVVPFAGTVHRDDSILKALDIMMDHNVSQVPVMDEDKLQGMIKLSDIFNTVAALLFDEQDPAERHQLLRDYDLERA
jgi:CBS domain-containing protein